MGKLKKLLVDILSNLGFRLIDWAASLDKEKIKSDPNGIVGYKASPAPHSFSSFKEGMDSKDYCTRHDAAAKLVGWYLYSNGHPFIEELVRAAEILLEDSSANAGDVSFLVGAWRDQASATTDEDREAAEVRENAIYDRVAIKVQK
jgi:hypothetical protein